MTLRPDLYNRLCAGFGKVRIINEGVEMRATVEHDALYDRPRLNVIDPGEYLAVNCPFCKDTRGRLWINHRWGRWDPQTKSRNLWLCVCYNEGCLDTYERQRALYDMVYNDITNRRGPASDPVLKGARRSRASYECKPPGDYLLPLHILEDDHPAVAYLRGRG